MHFSNIKAITQIKHWNQKSIQKIVIKILDVHFLQFFSPSIFTVRHYTDTHGTGTSCHTRTCMLASLHCKVYSNWHIHFLGESIIFSCLASELSVTTIFCLFFYPPTKLASCLGCQTKPPHNHNYLMCCWIMHDLCKNFQFYYFPQTNV